MTLFIPRAGALSYFSDIPPQEKQLRDNLDAWTTNPNCKGQKNVAASLILTAFQNNETELNLSNLGLSHLPEAIGLLTRLTKLNLTYNQLKNVDCLALLTNLEELNLSMNSLPSLGRLTDLPKLTKLNLRDNRFQDLNGLASFAALEELNLEKNGLADIKPICSLPHLKVLHLGENDLKDIPGLGSVRSLEDLYLNNNQLRDVESLGSLINLRSLALNGNLEIVSLPEGLKEAPITFLHCENTGLAKPTVDSVLAAGRKNLEERERRAADQRSADAEVAQIFGASGRA